MEEKRKDTGTQPAASSAATTSTATATPPKQSDTAASEPPTARRRGQKRKGNNSSGNTSNSGTTSSKRQAREKLSAVPFPPIHNGPCTRARQSPNTAAAAAAAASASFAASSAGVLKNELGMGAPLEFGGGKTGKAAEEELRAAKEDLEALEGKIEAEYENFRSRGTNAHVVPIHCGWFSWTKVHPLEERALPSFFNGKSQNQTPEIYMEIRNWIMDKFHANPNTQIELKDLSELSVGELDARQEVMEFLDYWGLINFHPLLETDSVMENADANGAAKTDSLAEILYCFEKEQSCAPVLRTNVATPAVPSGLFPESAIAEELVRPEGPAVEYHCNSCSADCSRKRYHCQKQADFDLCTECFNNGKFGSNMSPSDFILMEPAEVPGVSGGKWTDQETLLLLEALELYKENWNEIAEHVATKTKAQCILHFVQMPIEDTFLDCDDEIDASSKENADPVSTNNDSLAPKDAPETTESKVVANENQMVPSPMDISKSEDASELEVSKETSENFALKALTEAFEAVGSFPTVGDQLSFAEAANPAMALAAFLVGLVDPNVATASARNSSKMISSNSSGMHLASRHCFLLEDPPDYKKKSIDSERSVVQTVEQDAEGDDNQNDGKQKEKKSHDAEGDDNLNDGKQKEKKSQSVLDGSDISNDHNHEEDKDSVTEENGQLVSPSGKCIDKDHAVKEPNIVDTSEEVAPVLLNESDNADLSKDQAPSAKEESNDLISKDELLASSVKESEASECGSSQCAEAPKDADAVPLENKEPKELVTSNLMIENGATTGEEEVKDSKNANEDPSDSKNVNSDSKNANANEDPSDSKNANEEPSDSKNANANEEPLDSKNANEEPSDSKNANEDPLETKNDHSIDKVKRAAVTAISAAAVKAKILANQEEDQIRQLATLLIEKQLHKLETKLAFFSEMENLVTRVREQMDRSRQRLYHERAQIIAARLGLPASGLSASSSRPMQQSLPINRVAMGFANAAPRPPMNMTSQRPPVSRPIMTSGPPTLSPFVPTATAANSVRPSNQDKLSSVGMK